MKKIFTLLTAILLSASMATQAQESPIRDADVSATSSQIIVDETELLDDGIYVGDVTGPRKAPAATAYAMMKNSTVQYAEIMKLSTTNCYKIIIKVTNNYGGALKTGFVVTSFNTGSNTKIGGNHQFSSSYSNCTESDNWFTQNYSSSTGALYVDNPYGYIQFTYQSMGADGYPIYRIYIHDCYGYTSNNGCINWKSSGAIFSWDNNVSVHPMNANKDRIDFTDYYTISVSSNNNSYGTVSGGGTYAAGAARTLTASVASSSYQFLGWKKNGGSSYVSTSASYNVTVNGNDSYVAEFAPKAAPQYTITTAVSPSNTYGTVTGAGSYYENNPATLTATSANEHLYIFDHWLKDGNNYAGGATITPTVTAAATYTAVFRNAAEGTITGVANYGTISGTGHYTGGTAVTLTVTPNSGYKFAQWSDGNEDNPRTVYVDGDATYTAQFTDLNQPLLASFSWETDNISIETYGDGDGLCNSFYSPASKQFHLLYAKANNRSTKNYLNLSIQSSQTYMWGDVSFFKPGSYPVVSSGYTTGFCGNNGPYWYWTLDQTDVCVAYGYDSYNLGLNQLGSYLCDKSGNADDDSDQSNYISVGEGITCIIEVGANGDPYVRLVRNTDQQCLVSVGAPAVKYALSWDANGGALVGTAGVDYTPDGDYEEGTSIIVPNATREGYHLTEWEEVSGQNTYYDDDCGTEKEKLNVDESYIARWTADTYNLTYEGLNGALNSNPATYTIETATFTLANPGTRTGYTFNNWTCGGDPITQIVLGSTGNKTITANWTANQYAITYRDENDEDFSGTHGDGCPTMHTYGTATNLVSPTKENYNFLGWYDNEECTGDALTSIGATAKTAAFTLYAKWAASNYTITYNKGANGTGEAIANGSKTPGVDFTLSSSTYSRTGYTQTGWCTTDGGAKAYDLGGTYSTDANLDLYPFWTANTHNVSWVTDGNALTGNYTTGSTAYGTTIVAPNTPTKTATAQYIYTFKGWTPAVAATMPDNDVEYTATWTETPVNYTLTWTTDGDELTGEYTHGTVAYGTTIVAPATPTKDGFTFAGWTPAVAETMPAANTTYTATWRQIFVLKDGYGKDDDYYGTYNAKKNEGNKLDVRYERTFTKDRWCVFSVPFNYSFRPKENTTFNGLVYYLLNAEYTTDGVLTLNFMPNSTGIKANVPYIVIPKETIVNPVFNNVTLKGIDDGTQIVPNTEGTLKFINTQYRQTINRADADENKRVVYLSANHLYYPSASGDTWMRAFSGYFYMQDCSIYHTPYRLRFLTSEGDMIEQAMDNEAEMVETRKYIENGILVIERAGMKYDAQGHIIK